jgi:hypothetical protein
MKLNSADARRNVRFDSRTQESEHCPSGTNCRLVKLLVPFFVVCETVPIVSIGLYDDTMLHNHKIRLETAEHCLVHFKWDHAFGEFIMYGQFNRGHLRRERLLQSGLSKFISGCGTPFVFLASFGKLFFSGVGLARRIVLDAVDNCVSDLRALPSVFGSTSRATIRYLESFIGDATAHCLVTVGTLYGNSVSLPTGCQIASRRTIDARFAAIPFCRDVLSTTFALSRITLVTALGSAGAWHKVTLAA